MSQHEANLWEELFGTPERAAETLSRMGCLNPDTFEDCLSCPFFKEEACPAYDGRENILFVLTGRN